MKEIVGKKEKILLIIFNKSVDDKKKWSKPNGKERVSMKTNLNPLIGGRGNEKNQSKNNIFEKNVQCYNCDKFRHYVDEWF